MKIVTFFTFTVLEHGGGHEHSLMSMAKELQQKEPDSSIRIITMDETFSAKLGSLLNLYYFKKITTAPLKRESFTYVRSQIGEVEYIKCSSFKQLRREASRSDVLISKNELLEAVILKYIVRHKNIKSLIFDCATCLIYPYPRSIQAKLHNYLYTGYVNKHLSNKADAFIVKNSYEQGWYSKHFTKALSVLHPNSFDFENELFLRDLESSKFNVDGKIHISWVGRLTEQKGINDLLNIIKLSNSPHIKDKYFWHVVGDGDERGAIESLQSHSHNVTYYGHIANENIFTIIGRSDVFLSTSLWESFGNTLIEAMSQNIPCISKPIPGPSDIIIEGVNGYFASSAQDVFKSIAILTGDKTNVSPRKSVVDRYSNSNVTGIHEILQDI